MLRRFKRDICSLKALARRAGADQRDVVVSSSMVEACWRVIDAPSSFAIRYSHNDLDETLSMALIGELDLAAVGILRDHLRDLKPSGMRVRLDLSRLRFLDCSGLNAIVAALADAERSRWQLEVDPQVTAGVERTIRLADVAELFWPTSRRDQGSTLVPSAPAVHGRDAGPVRAGAASAA